MDGEVDREYELPPGRYLIPRPIPRGVRFGPGISAKELLIAVPGLLASVGLWFGLSAAGLHGVGHLSLTLLPALLGLVLVFPLDDSHLWEILRDEWAFAHRPHDYTYDWGADEW